MSRREKLKTDWATTLASYYITTPKFSEHFRMTHFWQMFVKADWLARCLILYNCGNWAENNWIQRLRGVPQYFCPDTVPRIKTKMKISTGTIIILRLLCRRTQKAHHAALHEEILLYHATRRALRRRRECLQVVTVVSYLNPERKHWERTEV